MFREIFVIRGLSGTKVHLAGLEKNCNINYQLKMLCNQFLALSFVSHASYDTSLIYFCG